MPGVGKGSKKNLKSLVISETRGGLPVPRWYQILAYFGQM